MAGGSIAGVSSFNISSTTVYISSVNGLLHKQIHRNITVHFLLNIVEAANINLVNYSYTSCYGTLT
jgi:hypothetical protein